MATGHLPHAVEIMREVGIDISGQRSKMVSETFRRHFTYVIAICEMPRERRPIWPLTRQIFKWNIIDAVTSTESSAHARQVLRRVREQLRANVEEFVQKTDSAGSFHDSADRRGTSESPCLPLHN